MSGLESAAAVIAVLTISCQTISALRNAIKELRSLPKEFEKLVREITVIQQCTAHIIGLITEDDETFRIFQRFQFAEAIEICATTCQEFHRSLSKWASKLAQSRRAQARLWFHRKDVESVRAEVSSARETTIFTAVSIHLYFEVKSSKIHKDKKEAYRRAQLDLRDMSSRAPDFSGHRLQNLRLGSQGTNSSMVICAEARNQQSQHCGEHGYDQGDNQPGTSHREEHDRRSSAQDYAQRAKQQSQETLNGVGESITQRLDQDVEANGQNNKANMAPAKSARVISQRIGGTLRLGETSRNNKINVVE